MPGGKFKGIVLLFDEKSAAICKAQSIIITHDGNLKVINTSCDL